MVGGRQGKSGRILDYSVKVVYSMEMGELEWRCKTCGKPVEVGRSYCGRRCITRRGWQIAEGGRKGELVEWQGVARVQAELLDAKSNIDRLVKENASLEGKVDSQGKEISVLQGQVATHDDRIMELTLQVRDLVRTLRTFERKANEGESWKG